MDETHKEQVAPITQELQMGHVNWNPAMKVAFVMLAAVLFGFGWQIRGSGTSDPTVAMMLLLLLIGIAFPRKKNNFVLFGTINLIFRIFRRGWGTFFHQGGIPGILDGMLAGTDDPTGNTYSVVVSWHQGYMWIFIVGLAWMSLTAVLLGAYMLSKKTYSYKDLFVMGLLYFGGYLLGLLVAVLVIPYMAPVAYQEVYLGLGYARNYISMRDNLAFAFGILPVVVYMLAWKRDKFGAAMTALIILIFGFSFMAAMPFQVIMFNAEFYFGANISFPGWSLWEYFAGFFAGGLIMLLYMLVPEKRWKESDAKRIGFVDKQYGANKFRHCILDNVAMLVFGFVALFLYAIQESTVGMINSTGAALGLWTGRVLGTAEGLAFIITGGLVLYIAYRLKLKKYFGGISLQEKYLLLIIVLLPFFWLTYGLQHVVTGNLFAFKVNYLVVWLNTISVIIVESAMVAVYIYLKAGKKFPVYQNLERPPKRW